MHNPNKYFDTEEHRVPQRSVYIFICFSVALCDYTGFSVSLFILTPDGILPYTLTHI
jgi:hypothetical protein